MTTCFGKELFIRFTVCVFRERLSVCECASFSFSFEGKMWDLIVSVSDHCFSIYFGLSLSISISVIRLLLGFTLINDKYNVRAR